MWHSAFITLHAASGVVSFVAGCTVLRRGTLFRTYLWSLAGMALFLALAIAAEWGTLGTALRVLFSAFVVLAGFMVWRADQARRIRPTAATGPSATYVEHVGFTLVALFDAFVVIAVLNAGGPAWLVATGGVLIAVAGHFALRTARSRLVPSASPSPVHLTASTPP
jgi:hypothetical protein